MAAAVPGDYILQRDGIKQLIVSGNLNNITYRLVRSFPTADPEYTVSEAEEYLTAPKDGDQAADTINDIADAVEDKDTDEPSETGRPGIDYFGPGNLATSIFHMTNRRDLPYEQRLFWFLLGVKLATYGAVKATVDRDFIEAAGAEDQCLFNFRGLSNTYMEQIESRGYLTQREQSRCWLCGFTIDELGAALEETNQKVWPRDIKSSPLNRPECEHILPAGAALLFTDVTQDATHQPTHLTALNYEHAHSCCNGLKSCKLFVSILTPTGEFSRNLTVNETNIGNYLNELFHTSRISTQLATLVSKLGGPTLPQYVQSRYTIIIARVNMLLGAINAQLAAGNADFSNGMSETQTFALVRNANTRYNKLTRELTSGKQFFVTKHNAKNRLENYWNNPLQFGFSIKQYDVTGQLTNINPKQFLSQTAALISENPAASNFIQNLYTPARLQALAITGDLKRLKLLRLMKVMADAPDVITLDEVKRSMQDQLNFLTNEFWKSPTPTTKINSKFICESGLAVGLYPDEFIRTYFCNPSGAKRGKTGKRLNRKRTFKGKRRTYRKSR